MNNNKMLYLMHIDWNWIKQRPQYMAEELSKKYEITVMYRHTYNSKSSLVSNERNDSALKIRPVLLLPNKLRKFAFFDKINTVIYRHVVKKYLKSEKPSTIYITYPTFINYIPKDYNGLLIYDCMDDHVAMEDIPSKKEKNIKNENKAVHTCNIILASSKHLQHKLLKAYNIEKEKIHIIRNGFNGPILPINELNLSCKSTEISYIGTISKWFDFDLLKRCIKDFPQITFKLIGPVDQSVQVPKVNSIKAVGAVNHDELLEQIKDSKALIMPFKLNDIIESVDPVKLYEYINFQKNIITVKYAEIERFSRFVYFYCNYEEFKSAIENVLNNDNLKYDSNDRISFLTNNSWDSRARALERIINEQR